MKPKIKIKTKESPDAILTSDWHLRDSTPPCRTDDFWETQWEKVKFISDLSDKYNIPVLHAGDLFHHWKPSPYLLTYTMMNLPGKFYTIYGNHDLAQHSLELIEKTGVYNLEQAGVLKILDSGHWGRNINDFQPLTFFNRKIGLFHIMTYQGKTPYVGCIDTPAAGLLRKYKKYDLIVTGHNHQTFVEEHEGRLLVNPGGIMRQESDEAEKQPVIFLYYAGTHTVERIDIPIEKGVVSKPIDTAKKQERDERIDAFISKLDSDFVGNISFEKNLTKLLQQNKTEKEVETIINECLIE